MLGRPGSPGWIGSVNGSSDVCVGGCDGIINVMVCGVEGVDAVDSGGEMLLTSTVDAVAWGVEVLSSGPDLLTSCADELG